MKPPQIMVDLSRPFHRSVSFARLLKSRTTASIMIIVVV